MIVPRAVLAAFLAFSTCAFAPSAFAQEVKLDALRAKAQERMRKDVAVFSEKDLREMEALYQPANQDMRASGVREGLLSLVQKFPTSNRAGCAVLYLAQLSSGEEREKWLTRAIEKHGDARYGDGTEVAAFARALLAVYYASVGKAKESAALVTDVQRNYAGSVDHSGLKLTETLKKMGLLK